MVDSLQANKDKDRRNLLLCNDLAKQYRSKSNDLEVKHKQLGQIHSEFEQKVQQKEVYTFTKKFFVLFLFSFI
jgi:hypothetical protein